MAATAQRARTAATGALSRLESTPPGRFAARLLELRVVDRALALASKLFIAILPLSILSTSLVSERSFGDQMVTRLGLTGSGAHAAHVLFASPRQIEAAFGFLGVLVLASSVLSFARALEAVYVDCWRLPPAPGRALPRRLAWLAGLFAIVTLLTPVRAVFADPLARRIAGATLAGAFFLWTPHLLLGGRLPWRRLVPTAAITGASILVAGLVSAVVMPRLLNHDTERYGLIGFTFGVVTWLFAMAVVLIAAAVLGCMVAGEPDAAGSSLRRDAAAADPE